MTPSEPATIDSSLIEAVCARLAANKPVRRTLPGWGRVHIDRQLPFLCVYRRPRTGLDEGTHHLITSEAAYLFALGSARRQTGVSELIGRITETLAPMFGGFLLVEISAGQFDPESWNGSPLAGHPLQPGFRMRAPADEALDHMVDATCGALAQIAVEDQVAAVEVVRRARVAPVHLPPLLKPADARAVGATQFGLEVRPIYRDGDGKLAYPVVLRELERQVTVALRQILFAFVRSHTSHRPRHYHGLGRRAVVKAVWEVDRHLASVGNGFDFILQVTPANAQQAYRQFCKHKCRTQPAFRYRPLRVDPVRLKRELYNVPLERLEDPALRQLFREKQDELDRKLTMLLDLDTARFRYGSVQLYGEIADSLVAVAERILAQVPPRTRDDSREGFLSPEAFQERAQAEIDYYRRQWPEFAAKAEIRDDTAGLMVSQGNLLISRHSRIPVARANALLHHEIGTHIVTFYNGRAQPFRQLYSGLAGYDALQEGLAVFAEFLSGGLSRPRLRLLAARVVAARRMVEGSSFVETFDTLEDAYGFERRTAFSIAVRIHRGGGLTKDAVYLKGLIEVLEYIQAGGKLEPLLLGKYAAEHVPIIEELVWRKVLSPPPLRPRYLDAAGSAERLAWVHRVDSILELLEPPARHTKPTPP